MEKKQLDLMNDLKSVLNEIDKDENTKEVSKEYANNFHKWLLDK